MKDKTLSYVVGGVRDKKCNNGTQYHMQDRIYLCCDLAVSITTSFNPFYLIKENNENKTTGGARKHIC